MGLFSRKTETRAEGDLMTINTAFPNDLTLRAMLGDNTNMTPEMAMQIPAFAACVNFLKDTIAMLPVKLYEQVPDESGKTIIKEIEDDPRCRLLNLDPKDTLNASEMKAALIKDYLLHGSGYIYINRARNNYKSLHFIDYHDMSVSKNADPIFKSYEVNINGGVYYPHQFIKILRSTTDGCTGIGVPFEDSKILSVAHNTLLYENLLVGKGGNKKGFLKSQKRITQDAIDALKAAWKKLYSNNEDNIVILNDGIEFQESSATSTEMQLNENINTNKREICGLFKICPAVLDEKATDEEYNLTIKMAVLPILDELTTSLNRDLLLEKEKGTYFFAFDTSEVMRGDIEKRYNAYKAAVSAGWITKNEIRARENMVAIDGLDIIGMSLGDVIYDVEHKTYFTPNTGTVADQDGHITSEGVVEDLITDDSGVEDKNPEKGGEPNADDS